MPYLLLSVIGSCVCHQINRRIDMFIVEEREKIASSLCRRNSHILRKSKKNRLFSSLPMHHQSFCIQSGASVRQRRRWHRLHTDKQERWDAKKNYKRNCFKSLQTHMCRLSNVPLLNMNKFTIETRWICFFLSFLDLLFASLFSTDTRKKTFGIRPVDIITMMNLCVYF